MVGGTTGQLLGSSVAMSKDGNYMVVGSLGHNSGDGAIYLCEWKNSAWNSFMPLGGTHNSREALGTSVAFLSDDGKTVAFGGPGFGDNQGVVKVYQESSQPGFYVKVGNQDIIGNIGERIGT